MHRKIHTSLQLVLHTGNAHFQNEVVNENFHQVSEHSNELKTINVAFTTNTVDYNQIIDKQSKFDHSIDRINITLFSNNKKKK